MTSYLQLMLFGLERIILKDYIKFGMTVHSLRYKEFEEMPIPLPPISEQKMILDFFKDFSKNTLEQNREYFDSEIEKEVVSIHQTQIYNNQISTELNHQLALVKELRQAYLREAMQGKLARQDSTDDPAEILLEKIKAEKEKLAAEKKIKRDKSLPPLTRKKFRLKFLQIGLGAGWAKLPKSFVAAHRDQQATKGFMMAKFHF
jgi:restriction endonuclease S subunit